MDWLTEVWHRLQPSATPPDLSWRVLLLVAGAALVVVVVPALWRLVRLVVTLVHELGHAFTGIACGRRFTGFVLRSDMSGHAVTAGPTSGFGLALTTWAGYPAPFVVSLLLVVGVARGWAAPLLSAGVVALVVALPRVRSLLTGLVLVVVLVGVGALWWWRDDQRQALLLIGVAVVLLVGAWRHLIAVATSGDARSDPGLLARQTRVPRLVWVLSYGVVAAAATILGVGLLLPR